MQEYNPLQQQALRAAIASLEHAERQLHQAGAPEELRTQVLGIAHDLKPYLPKAPGIYTPTKERR